jgi:hypothetical protein
MVEKYDVMGRLFNVLEGIEVDGKLFRATDTNSSFEGDILNFNLNYDGFMYVEQSEDAMDELEYKN